MKIRTLLPIALLALALVAPAHAAAPRLKGPKGTNYLKTLVIGTDGTRWDLLQGQMNAGRAPNLRGLVRRGIGGPTVLPYAPPAARTLSEVGWSTIAAGVGPDKHGIRGSAFNTDPGQATKNGYLDFLTRLERVRPRLSTFVASDWPNIGMHENGGPIFGDPIDTRSAFDASLLNTDQIKAWDMGDDQVTAAAARYLRDGNPDAGFVYLGTVDEHAHEIGSATPAYGASITATDKRIGKLLTAIRSRPSYGRERWTVIVTTDHGQLNLSSGSIVSHGGGSDLERTSFVVAAGPGIRRGVAPGVVDIHPTVIHQAGLAVDPAWKLDGRSFVTTAVPPPPPTATARLRVRDASGGISLRFTTKRGAPKMASARLSLPKGLKLKRALVRTTKGRVKVSGTALTVRASGAGAARITVTGKSGSVALSKSLARKLRKARTLTLTVTITERGGDPASQEIVARVTR